VTADVREALRRLSAFGERLPVEPERDADALRRAGWTRSDRLADPAAWPEIARRYGRRTMGIDRLAPAASCALQGYAGRVAGATVGVWAQTGALLDLAHDAVWVRLLDGRVRGVAVPDARVRATGASVDAVADELLLRHLAPILEASRTVSRLRPRVLWGNVAAACAGAFGTIHRALDPDARPRLRALADAFLSATAWPHDELVALHRIDEHPDALPHERRTCCLMRLSAKGEECASCERLAPEERDRRLRAAAAAAVPVPSLPADPRVLAAAAVVAPPLALPVTAHPTPAPPSGPDRTSRSR